MDFNYLNEVLVFAHPSNYNPDFPQKNLDDLLIKIENLQEDSLTFSKYLSLVNSALYKFQCVHTNIVKNPFENSKKRVISYFPNQLILFEDELFLEPEDSTNYEQITQINGINTRKIIPWIIEYRASDGGTSALSKSLFEKHSSQLISKYFDYPNYYEIRTNKRTIVKQSIPVLNTPRLTNSKVQKTLSNNDNYLFIKNGVPCLKISSFSKSDKKFFKKA